MKSKFTNMTVHAAPVFGVLELNCESITYDKVDFILGPTPAGATEARLKTATADGMKDWPSIRAQNGHKNPFKFRYVQIGNETWAIRLIIMSFINISLGA